MANAVVYAGDRAGDLLVDASTSRSGPPAGDLCTAVTVYGRQETSCRTVRLGTVDVRVGTAVIDGAQCEFATRYATDGQITVTQCLTARAFQRPAGSGLERHVFSSARLAEVAASFAG